MPVKVTILQEGRSSLTTFSGIVTIEDGKESAIQLLEILERTDAPMDRVVDLREIEQVTFTVQEILGAEVSRRALTHPNQRWSIYVGKQNPFYNMLLSMINQNVKARARFVDTMEEALAFLDELQLNLPTQDIE